MDLNATIFPVKENLYHKYQFASRKYKYMYSYLF